jgi:hypothetical protein
MDPTAKATVGLPLELKRHVNAVCNRFESSWQAAAEGSQPRIEDHLELVADPARALLLSELVHIDAHYRSRRGEAPAADDYLGRFPSLEPAWLETVLPRVLAGSRTAMRSASELLAALRRHGLLVAAQLDELARSQAAGSADPRTLAEELLDRAWVTPYQIDQLLQGKGHELALGAYVLLDRLGAGGMGVVYKARDRRRGDVVALKVLPRAEPERLARFKQEFRTLAGVVHPNLVALYELVAADGQWFFTMELVQGGSFLDHIRGVGPQGLRAALQKLADGLSALHAAGKLHCDVKPSNVLVTPAGRVVLLDFGLAEELGPGGSHESSDPQFVGTVAYMSPEQAACLPLTPASDWYSVGVLLYEALTGTRPFRGPAWKVLHDKQRQEPSWPADLTSELPSDLAELCAELLRLDPGRRPDGAEVRRRLGTTPVVGPALPASTPFLGREAHLAALREAFAALGGGRPQVVSVQGCSGMGKTALAQHFLDEAARTDGVVVLAGRCYQQESVPYKAVDSMVDTLTRHWRRLPRDRAAELLPRDVEPLVRVFPVLDRVEAVSGAPRHPDEEIDPTVLRRRAFAALREVLTRLGDRVRLILAIDDLQWGDSDSARLLLDLLRPPDPPRLMLLACYRREDVEFSSCLQALREGLKEVEGEIEQRELAVGPLPPGETLALARALLEDRSQPAEVVAHESQGCPYFIHELAQHAGAGLRDPATTLDQVLWSRVERLPAEARALLEVVAVAGRPLGVAEVSAAAGLGGIPHAARTLLHTGRFITPTGLDEAQAWNCAHDRVREAVLANLPNPARRDIHRRLAEALEGPAGRDPPAPQLAFDVAAHFDAAGDSARALPYALAAADLARAQCSLEAAQQQYEIAERGAEGAGAEVRFRAAEGLGDVLMLRAQYDAAAVRYQTALALAPSAADRARVQGSLGELALKLGKIRAGAEAVERALRMVGRWVPRGRLGAALGAAWEGVVQLLHAVWPRRFLARRPAERGRADLLAARLYNRLTYPYWFERGRLATLWSNLKAMNLAEAYPPSQVLAQAYSVHAPAMTLLGWFRRGADYAERSLAIRRDLNDVWGQGQTLNFYGVALYASARYEECLARSREAIRLLEQTGDRWEQRIARYHLTVSLYRLGDLRGAAAEAEDVCRSTLELKDFQARRVSGWLDAWAKATGGAVPADVLRAALALPRDDVLAANQALQAEGVWHLRHGRPHEAAASLRQADVTARAAHVCNALTAPAVAWLATALRHEADQVQAANPEEATRLRRQAESVARRAARLARRFRADLPHALRERGLLLAALGRPRKGLRRLEESLTEAQRQGARYEQAQTRLALARLRAALGVPGAAGQEVDLERELRALEVLAEDRGNADCGPARRGHGPQAGP